MREEIVQNIFLLIFLYDNPVREEKKCFINAEMILKMIRNKKLSYNTKEINTILDRNDSEKSKNII